MAKRTFDDAAEDQTGEHRFAESIPVKDVPQQEIQSPYPRIRTKKKENESISPNRSIPDTFNS